MVVRPKDFLTAHNLPLQYMHGGEGPDQPCTAPRGKGCVGERCSPLHECSHALNRLRLPCILLTLLLKYLLCCQSFMLVYLGAAVFRITVDGYYKWDWIVSLPARHAFIPCMTVHAGGIKGCRSQSCDQFCSCQPMRAEMSGLNNLPGHLGRSCAHFKVCPLLYYWSWGVPPHTWPPLQSFVSDQHHRLALFTSPEDRLENGWTCSQRRETRDIVIRLFLISSPFPFFFLVFSSANLIFMGLLSPLHHGS